MQDLIPTDPETAKEMAKLANQYLSEIAKSPLQEFGGLITDKVKYWRASLQLKQLEKLTKKIKKAGFVPNKLEMKVLFPCLEGISLEEDEKMQNTWTDLMMNYVDPAVNLKLNVYPETLKQLSTPEVQALECLYNRNNFPGFTSTEENNLPYSISYEIAANLVRLGLLNVKVAPPVTVTVTHNKETGEVARGIGSYGLSSYGEQFVKACTRP